MSAEQAVATSPGRGKEVSCLFVYGTLRRATSHPAHELLGDSEHLGPARVRGLLYDLGEYPGAVRDEGDAVIRGELFQLREPNAVLSVLDDYEGVDPTSLTGDHFARFVTDAQLESGVAVECWIYWYVGPLATASAIPSGDYLDVVRPEQV